ncbi:hypothetical protein FJT64_002564 [Amphibalanus amphitrite]|uniref:Uncharacterized protein n=1 Tax=Amphibalanus amphitrite TaxID=1232801 RepID=A0A6A4WHI8_AMPAM|nr:hypothetical protein FJT64_002564 [Amphibalanus amphitrite]
MASGADAGLSGLNFSKWRHHSRLRPGVSLSGSAGGVETVLSDYGHSGELLLDVLLGEKAFVPLRHPSENYRRVNADCRALLRRLLKLPGREYESQAWVQEILKHIRCEGLRVLVYTGC